MKKTIKRIVSFLCMLCLLASVWLPLLPAAPAERALAAPASVSDEITVTDGSRYIVTVSYDTDAGIPEGAALRVRELTEADEGYGDYLARSAEALGAEKESIQFARALDISLYDPLTMEEYQPTGSVSVSITLPDVALEESGSVSVLHFGEEPEVLPASVSENAVAFETEGFSVYLVVAHESEDDGTPVEEPRVEFHYLSPEFTYSSGDQNYTAGLFRFPNKGGDFQTSQILRNGETMEMIANPPNRTDENGTNPEYFFGWYLVECRSVAADGQVTYTWTDDPEKIGVEQRLTLSKTEGVTVGETLTWTLGAVSGSGVVDAEGLIHVYLAPIYQDYYFINFHMGALDTSLAGSIRTRLLVVLGSDNAADVRIGNITATSSDSKHQIFSGWKRLSPDEYYQTVNVEGKELSSDENAAPGTLGEYWIHVETDSFSGNALDLYPVYDEARWVNFYLGAAHNGAEYVGADYLLTHDGGAGTYFTAMPTTNRAGYDFLGWYADAVVDPDTGEILNLPVLDPVTGDITNPENAKPVTVRDKDGHEHTEDLLAKQLYDGTGALAAEDDYVRYFAGDGSDKLYELEDGKLWFYKALDDLTLYARWQPQEVNYTVVYWLQNANDDNYSVMHFETKQGLAGAQTAVTEIPTSSSVYTENKLKFAHLSPDQDKSEEETQSGIQNTAIAGDGSTIVNVYYDRNVYKLRFDIGFARRTSTNNSTSFYNTLSAAELETYEETVYGVVDGNMVELTSDGNGGWTYSGTKDVRNPYTGEHRYLATTDNAGTQYGVVGGEVVELSGGISYTRTDRYRYVVSTSNTNGNYYIFINGGLNNTQLYNNNGRWYRTRNGNGYYGYTYSNEYTGTRFNSNRQQDNNNVVGTGYSGTLYYFDSNGTISTSGSGTPYGSTTANEYFQVTESGAWTYNGGTAYPAASPRYLRVENNDADTSYTLGFIDGSMQTVLHDDDGWYYNTQVPAELPYTGTLYKYESVSGTWQYSVSNTTGPNYADNNNWDSFLTQRRIDLGTTNPFLPTEYTGYYNVTQGGTPYMVFYYDLTAKYGEYILDRYPSTQSAKSGAGAFVGWLAQRDSYYNARLSTSIKGFFETMTEDLILTGGPIPDDNAKVNNVSPNDYTAITVDQDNAYIQSPSHGNGQEYHGITQEFRCRYNTTDDARNAYLYRLYLADPETRTYPTEPTYQNIVVAGSGSYPNLQTATTFYGYTLADSKVIDSSGTERTPGGESGTGSYSPYTVTEINDAGVTGTGMIMVFRYLPNAHTISFQYGSAAAHPNTAIDSAHESYDFYYGQSLSRAKGYADTYAAADGVVMQNLPEGHSFKGWYTTPNGADGSEVDFTGTMPDADLIIYAVYTPDRFRVKIDPNGGQIDRYDHNGGYTDDFHANGEAMGYYGATFFKNDYGQTISYYEMDGWRNYVEITASEAADMRANGEPVYVYMNTQYTDKYDDDGYDLESPLRSALYLREDELETYHNFYYNNPNLSSNPLGFSAWKDEYLVKDETGELQYYRPLHTGEKYTFLGWFLVNADGSVGNVPYDNSLPTTAVTTLRAMWRLDNTIKVEYIPDSYVDTVHINASLTSWMDPDITEQNYVDGAETVITQQPTGITADDDEEEGKNYIFRGWRLVSVKKTGGITTYKPLQSNVYYDPGDDFTIQARYAQEVEKEGQKQLTIFLQAVYEYKDSAYRRAGVTDLILDPNDMGTVSGTLPTWEGSGTVTMTGNQLRFTGSQSNDAVFLSDYTAPADATAGTYGYFSHAERFYLLGFDDAADEGDYIATYPADGLISNWRQDATHTEENRTVYAVWEPMVYLTVKNETGLGPVSFTLDADTANVDALYVVNKITGAFDRVDFKNQVVTVEVGDSVTLVLPFGKEKTISLVGTNTLGPGQMLVWNSSVELNGTTTKTNGAPVTYTHTPEGESGSHTHTLAAGGQDNNLDFRIPAELIEDPKGVTVTFTTLKHDYTLILHDNYREVTREFYPEAADIAADGPYELSTPTSRFPYTFLGYDFDRLDDNTVDAEHLNEQLDYPFSADFNIPHIGSFFNDNDTNHDRIVTLYAAWNWRLESRHTLVTKAVSDLGDKELPFRFVLTLSGSYRPGSGAPVTMNGDNNVAGNVMSEAVELKDGEYLDIYTTQQVGESYVSAKPYIQAVITRYDASDVQIGEPKTIRWQSSNNITGEVTFDELAQFTLTEDDYTAEFYDTAVDLTAEQTAGSYTVSGDRSFSWDKTDYSGALTVTNTRQTARVTVRKTIGNTESGLPPLEPFRFSASYTLPGSSESDSLGSFSVAGGESHLLTEEIPVGATIVIQEALDDDRYTTAASDDAATHGSFDASDLSYALTVPNSDTTVTYTNTLKSFPVRIVLVDQDGNIGPEGRFDLDADYTSLRSGYWTRPDNNLIYSGRFYAGHRYRLEETDVEEGYLPVLEEAVFQVTGTGVSDPGVKGVTVEPDGAGYLITVINRKTVSITVETGLKDPLLNRRTFYYTYSYQMPGEPVTNRSFSIEAHSTADGSVSAAEEPAVLTIPVGARDLRIREDTSRTTTAPETVGSTYDIYVKYNDNDRSPGAEYVYASALTAGNEGDRLIFTNEKKTVKITLQKSAELEEGAKKGVFSFQVTLLNGATPIKNYTLYDGGNTDSSGTVSFELKDIATDPTDPDRKKVLTVPVGAILRIRETGAVDGSGNAISEDSYVASAAAAPNDSSSTAVLSVSAVPGGGGKTFSFQAPGEDATVTVTNQSAGVDVSFFKIDGFGKWLEGATFALYRDADCTSALDKTGTSIADGTVTLSKVPFGVHYMKEEGTVTSEGIAWENKNTYILLVGDAELARYSVYGLTEDDIEAQTSDGAVKYAIFFYDKSTGKAVTTPDIATFGILNVAQAERKVLLRKTGKKADNSYEILQGAHFLIFRPDLTEVTEGQEAGKNYYESLASGIWFIGSLPYGKYYLVETAAPAGYSAGKVYVLQVREDGFFDGAGIAVKQLEVPEDVNGSTEEAIVSAFKEWRRG